jgi:hypothetical protein
MPIGPTQADRDYCIRAQAVVVRVMNEVMREIVPCGEQALYFGYIAAGIRGTLSNCFAFSAFVPPVTVNPYVQGISANEADAIDHILRRAWRCMMSGIQEFQQPLHRLDEETKYFLLKFQEEFDRPTNGAVTEAWAKQAPFRQW